MHLLRADFQSLDANEAAVDLDQSPADVVFLSFSDSDLNALAAAWSDGPAAYPSLRMANLGALKHPYSVDLYIEKSCSRAKFILIRLLGGRDYWRYGVEEFAALARAKAIPLAIVPGDWRADPRLESASTLPSDDLVRIWRWFSAGGVDNLRQCLAYVSGAIGRPLAWREAQSMPPAALCPTFARSSAPDAARVLLVAYRSLVLARDAQPIADLADAFAARGCSVETLSVTSLKDRAAGAIAAGVLARGRFDVIVNTTAFSGRSDDGASALDGADAPVIQAILSNASRAAWREGARGLGPADLAMNVVLPEIDGRLIGPAIAFKTPAATRAGLEFTPLINASERDRIDAAADLACAWARLRKTPASARKIAIVLPDYPHKGGRAGFAIGLDAPASVAAICESLRAAGYDIGPLPACDALARGLERREARSLGLADYRRLFGDLPAPFRSAVVEAWGDPADDPDLRDGAFAAGALSARNLVVALQPERGSPTDRRARYHDPNLPPRHSYIAFYLWLRRVLAIDALVLCGAHATLEWLPGKAVALGADCAPQAILGSLPVIYPFIVNNPGEAAQAKRRLAAVALSHLTPPLVAAGAHGEAAQIESMLEEYASALLIDPRRARRVAAALLARAHACGLAEDAGVQPGSGDDDALLRLDSWLCEVKESRIAGALHVFGRVQSDSEWFAPDAAAATCPGVDLSACAASEMAGLLAALEGRFVQPGPGGSLARGRLDILPTGRNLFSLDPRTAPTRTAWEIGRQTADDVLARHLQDVGDWPRTIVLDLWGGASVRTGGEDLAQALWLIGAKPKWDDQSARVLGFEILTCAAIGRPRVDATLRISGLFRDLFPMQITLFDDAVRAIAALDEPDEENPLAALSRASAQPPARIFGAAPGAYGTGLARRLAEGNWVRRSDLADAYLQNSGYAYGRDRAGEAAAAFAEQVRRADAYVHVHDLAERDLLEESDYAEHAGGFAAAAEALGAGTALYHVDAAEPDRRRVRTLKEEFARALQARAVNPRWLRSRIPHGYRGAADIAELVDNAFALAALTNVVESRHFDRLFDAVCADDAIRAFVIAVNPRAARALAERFGEARQRGLWRPLRNSVDPILEAMREAS